MCGLQWEHKSILTDGAGADQEHIDAPSIAAMCVQKVHICALKLAHRVFQ